LIGELEDKSPSSSITERRRLTEQLSQITRELKRAKLNLQEINKGLPRGQT
jgi:hypothetical protein